MLNRFKEKIGGAHEKETAKEKPREAALEIEKSQPRTEAESRTALIRTCPDPSGVGAPLPEPMVDQGGLSP